MPGGWKRPPLLLLAALVGILFSGALASWAAAKYAAAGGQPPSAGSSYSPATVSPSAESGGTTLAPDFTLTLFDGRRLRLSDLRGKPVVLNFWASWCPPCREEAPTLEKGWETYKDKGVVFLGMDIQDTETDARAFMKEFGITYPNGQDTTSEIAVSYDISGIPTTFFITSEGKVARRWTGALGEEQLDAFIGGLLQ